MAQNRKSTRQLLAKIPNVPCLYRHKINGTYYGVKKASCKRKEHSLATADRKLAERRLKAWIDDLDRIDAKAAKITIEALLEKFVAVNKGRAEKTRATDQSIINAFKRTWRHGLNMQVGEIKPSHLNEWLAHHEGRLKHTSYNRYAGFLKQLFEIATRDRMISESPFESVKTKWKKPQKPIRYVPTIEQFYAIVKEVRSQKHNDDAEDSADFIQFLGEAGVGQAEASSLTKGDIDWERNRIRFRRHKTQAVFYVPIYNHLKPLLEKLAQRCGADAALETKLLQTKDAKKALAAACRRLDLKNFSQRSIRQALIRRLWQSGVDYKLISKWQGHPWNNLPDGLSEGHASRRNPCHPSRPLWRQTNLRNEAATDGFSFMPSAETWF
jgi:integrase